MSLITASVKWNYSYSLIVLNRIKFNQLIIFGKSLPLDATDYFMKVSLLNLLSTSWKGCPHLLSRNDLIPIQVKKQQKWKARTSYQWPTMITASGSKQGGGGCRHQSETVLWCEVQSFCSTVYEVPFFAIWRCITGYLVTDNLTPLQSLKTSGTKHQVIQHHIYKQRIFNCTAVKILKLTFMKYTERYK